MDNVDKFVDEILASGVELIALDTETYYDDELAQQGALTKWIKGSPNNIPFGVSLCTEIKGELKGYWIDHDIEKLRPILEDEGIAKILHNSKYDLFMLLNLGLQVKGRIWDTMSMIHLIDEEMECKTPKGNMKRSKALKDLAYHFLGDDAHELEDLVSKTRTAIAKFHGIPKSEVSYKMVNDVAPRIMMDYAIADTEFCWRLFPIFLEELKHQNLMGAYEIEANATLAVLNMERRGVLVDREKLLKDKQVVESIIVEITWDVDKLVKTPFNLNSNDEVVETFNRLGVRWEWYTDKDSYKVDEDTLKHVKTLYPDCNAAKLCDLILEYRSATKILSTYIDGILNFIQYDGRVHADFWLSPDDFSSGGTVTGRLSSSNPNLQNIPKKPISIRGYELNIRSYFIAPDGYRLVFQDAKQQEYRVLAHYANDENFMAKIHEGLDIHKATASMMFGVPVEEVTGEQRDRGKTVNFSVVYGLSNPALAKSLGHDIDEGKLKQGTKHLYKAFKVWEMPPYDNKVTPEMMFSGVTDPEVIEGIEYFLQPDVQHAIKDAIDVKKKYFDQFPKIKQFIKECSDTGKKRGFIIMWGGRIRHFKNPAKQSYMAPNSLIQGSCAMIMKVKLHEINEYLKCRMSGLVMSIHDEVITEVHESELDIVMEMNELLSDLPFRVPIEWDNEWGYDWGDKNEFEMEYAKD